MLFSYDQSLSCVKLAMSKLNRLNIPYQRPVDYYAEMIKTDAHMSKVKARLLSDQKKIKALEDYKHHQQNVKFGKQARSNREQEQARLKRTTLDAISDLRRNHRGELSDSMVDAALSGNKSSNHVGSKYKKQKRGVRLGKSRRK
jgi:rRNA-processing protein EBP2